MGLFRIGQMYFGSQSVAEEQRGNENKMWLAVRPIVNLQTLIINLLHIMYSIELQQHNRICGLAQAKTKTQRHGDGSLCN